MMLFKMEYILPKGVQPDRETVAAALDACDAALGRLTRTTLCRMEERHLVLVVAARPEALDGRRALYGLGRYLSQLPAAWKRRSLAAVRLREYWGTLREAEKARLLPSAEKELEAAQAGFACREHYWPVCYEFLPRTRMGRTRTLRTAEKCPPLQEGLSRLYSEAETPSLYILSDMDRSVRFRKLQLLLDALYATGRCKNSVCPLIDTTHFLFSGVLTDALYPFCAGGAVALNLGERPASVIKLGGGEKLDTARLADLIRRNSSTTTILTGGPDGVPILDELLRLLPDLPQLRLDGDERAGER